MEKPVPPQEADGGATRQAERGASAPPAWLRNVAVWVGAGLAFVVLVVLGVAVLPGWWASLVGGWVQGVFGRGVPIGLGVGALFTVLPLALGALAFRSGLRSQMRMALIVAALLLLLPNVLTTAIALGSSDARSMLVIAAPGFRGATWAGIGGVVLLLAAVALVRWRSRRTSKQLGAAEEKAAGVAKERAAEAEARALETEQDPDPDASPPVGEEPEPEPRTE